MALLLGQCRGPQPWSSRGCRLVARQFLCSQVDLHGIRRFSFPTMHFSQIQFFLAVTSKLYSFFGMGNCVQLLPWFYCLWHSTADDRGICIFKCSLPIKLTTNFFLTGSLFCIRALYQQNSLPRIHSSLLQLIATYSFINWTQLLLWPAFWPK